MSTKATISPSPLTLYDSASHERTLRLAPLQFYDDFLGAFTVIPVAASPESGCVWTKKIVGDGPPTVAGVASAANGVIQCALTNKNQKQDGVLLMSDQRLFDLTKGLVFETRIKLTVTPDDVAEAYWGLFDNWADGEVDAATYMACFTCDGSTAVYVETDDNGTDRSYDSGKTALTTDWHIYRIEIPTVADMHFYIDGVEVCAAYTFPFAATGANAILQPMIGLYKATGTGVGTVQVDYVKIWQNRS